MIYIILLSGICIIAAIIVWPAYKKHKRSSISSRPFPMQWEQSLANYWPIFSRIPYELKIKLRKHILNFMAEKQMIGCQGLKLSEQEQVIIAAQACLLIVNKSFERYDQLKSILIYPSSFITHRDISLGNGTIASDKRILSGEAWETGKVIISWNDTVDGIANDKDGNNVVLHEFAHLLDHESGTANGAPVLNNRQDYVTWSQTLNNAFNRLQNNIESGQPTLFNPYGASNPAEFFAVVTELFFENGLLLKTHEQELYEQLKSYYEVDTATWI